MTWLDEVILGGTFDHLHLGHKAVLEAAISISKYVRVGVTSDIFARKMRRNDKFIHHLQPFKKRERNVQLFLEERGCQKHRTMKIHDRYGPALTDPYIEAIIATEETYPTAVEINKLRNLNGLDHLLILVVPFVYDEKGIIISSRRIRQQLGEKAKKE